jgi:hypothetical protein
VSWKLFEHYDFRVFVIPIAGDNSTRVVVVTNRHNLLQEFRHAENLQSPAAQLLAYHMLSPAPGEWVTTKEVITRKEIDLFKQLSEQEQQSDAEHLVASNAVPPSTLSDDQETPETFNFASTGDGLTSSGCLLRSSGSLGMLDSNPITGDLRMSTDTMQPPSVSAGFLSLSLENETVAELELEDKRLRKTQRMGTVLPLFPHQERSVIWMQKMEVWPHTKHQLHSKH